VYTVDQQPLDYSAAGAGRAAPLVLVPGWGHGRSVFEPILGELAGERRVIAVDPPGAGASRPDRCGADLDALADSVAAVTDVPAAWAGWSLGGLITLMIAWRWPERVSRVILLASSPRFVAEPGWPGIDAELLGAFADAIAADPARGVERFHGLELAPGRGRHRTLAALRASLRQDGVPDMGTLRAGLDLLRQTDLRAWMRALPCRVDVLLGERDPLLPADVAAQQRRLGARVRVLPGLGHAAFVAQPRTVVDAIREIEREPSP
jgi:pimeloyl-[acyl-carrier protein] methyl ester esterase